MTSTDTSVLSLLRAGVRTVSAALIQRAGEIQLNMLQYLWRLLGWGDATAVPADNENSNQILTEHEDASVTQTTRSCDGGVAENPEDSAQNVTEDSEAGFGATIQVTIRTFDGKCRPMDIDTADTVFNVITLMSKQIGRKPEDLMMVFDGCILEDEKRIQDCGIRRGRQINLIQRPKKPSPLKRR